jgi:hypothetical protein
MEGHLVFWFLLLSSGASPMQRCPQAQAERRALTEPTSLLIGAFTEHGGPRAPSLPDGSSLLWVPLGSQKRDQGMEFLLCLTDGDDPCPQVSCPRFSFRSQDLAWWNAHKTLSLICSVWILLNWPWCALGPPESREGPGVDGYHMA